MSPRQFPSEEALVSWLAQRAVAIGDDAALLPAIGAHAITVDSQREGVHFLSGTPASVIARRLLAVNLSDLAAVGVRPRRVLCALAAPTCFPMREFFEALLDACDHYDVELIGGDLSKSPTIEGTITAIGERLPRARFLTRGAAEPGQSLWLAGNLGESHLGLELLRCGARIKRSVNTLTCTLPRTVPRRLRLFAQRCLRQHLSPTPQLACSQYLSQRRCAIAAIDISDGLAKDLKRLANASRVGLRIDLHSLFGTTQERPFRALCQHLGASARQSLLAGGEDYSLVFTIPQSYTRALEALHQRSLKQLPKSALATETSTFAIRIGEVTATPGEIVLVDGDQEHRLDSYLETQLHTAPGFDHLEQRVIPPPSNPSAL